MFLLELSPILVLDWLLSNIMCINHWTFLFITQLCLSASVYRKLFFVVVFGKFPVMLRLISKRFLLD